MGSVWWNSSNLQQDLLSRLASPCGSNKRFPRSVTGGGRDFRELLINNKDGLNQFVPLSAAWIAAFCSGYGRGGGQVRTCWDDCLRAHARVRVHTDTLGPWEWQRLELDSRVATARNASSHPWTYGRHIARGPFHSPRRVR